MIQTYEKKALLNLINLIYLSKKSQPILTHNLMTQFFQGGNSTGLLSFLSRLAGKEMASHKVPLSLIRKQRFFDLTLFA